MKDSLFSTLRILICIGLLLSAGLKLWDLPGFYDTLAEWTLVPAPLIPVVTIGVPIAEVLAVTLCLASSRPGLGQWSIPALLAGFTIALMIEDLISPAPVACGCLGRKIDLSPVPAWQHAVVNAALCLPFILRHREKP